MRIRKTIFTSLLIVLFACMPAFANINLEVNNQSINNDEGYLLNNGVTFVEAKLINSITGAKVTTEAEDVIITKNDKTIKLTLGQESFLVNEESRDLIIAPYLTDNQIMLPLRPVAEALGAKVAWDANSNTVNVSFLETKNGLTANDLLIKTSAISNELPTYDMEGSMDFRMNMSGIEEEGFPVDMTMNSKLYAHYEKEPLA
ncbi:MAG: copper amine oxidase N-terminal domain-containing protein, partial [Syntrophomonadaceae bacterium]|nr:copper amine oxidase N-terminal domain-containing protein [Syntrophomonadaceae bacterium]